MKQLILILSIFIIFAMPATGFTDFQRTKIAVLDFQLQGQGHETTDMGKIVAEWLITALVRDGRFDLIERRLLKKILGEQKLVMTGVVDETSATKLGKLLGVKVIISGSVMKFENMTEVNARIIDVESASIITAESVKSTSTTRLEDLVKQMAEIIIKDFPLEGYVVLKKDNSVSIDLGRKAGVKEGMQFIVYKEGKIIKHPKTGEVLDVEKIKTGKVEIRSVRDNMAEADIISENATNGIHYGQLVKSLVTPRKALSTSSSGSSYTKPSDSSPAAGGVQMQLSEIDPMIEDIRQLKESGQPLWKTRYKQTMGRLKIIYGRYPTSPNVFFYYARVFNVVENLRKVNKMIAKAIYYDPNFVEALVFKGDSNYAFGKKLASQRKKNKLSLIATDAYKEAARINQDVQFKAMMYYKIGNVYAELAGDSTMANEFWQKASSIAPSSEGARLAGDKNQR